jgi:hypothetical protein
MWPEDGQGQPDQEVRGRTPAVRVPQIVPKKLVIRFPEIKTYLDHSMYFNNGEYFLCKEYESI